MVIVFIVIDVRLSLRQKYNESVGKECDYDIRIREMEHI